MLSNNSVTLASLFVQFTLHLIFQQVRFLLLPHFDREANCLEEAFLMSTKNILHLKRLQIEHGAMHHLHRMHNS